VITSCVLPSLLSFNISLKDTKIEYYGVIVYYGSKNFVVDTNVNNLLPEALCFIVSKENCLRFLNLEITESELLNRSYIFISDRDMPIGFKKIELDVVIMKKAFLLLVIIIIAVSCSYSGWSLREQGYIKNIPANYQTHQSGIIKNPSRKDINDAIIFGKLEKDGRAVDYAYITKTSFGNIIVYCRIYTPLRLISEHSRNCAREYIKINDTTIEYLSKNERS